jgi:hypothetical protein
VLHAPIGRCRDVRFVATVGFVTARVTGVCVALALGVAACGGDSGADARPTTTVERTTTSSSSTTVPERPASTTTTAYDRSTVEGQVEAAYLKSWDVYADAVYNLKLDEDALAEVYADQALSTQISEIRRRMRDGAASLVRVDHAYTVALTDSASANVIDQFVNHQVRIDPKSKEPLEPDPNSRSLLNFRMRLIGGSWKVVFIERVTK